jgi:hypothetical protein
MERGNEVASKDFDMSQQICGTYQLSIFSLVSLRWTAILRLAGKKKILLINTCD